ncbi:MAG: M10 family metallopeptidase C-terminal domain-containing protein, partial [Pirellulaceae bacterium]
PGLYDIAALQSIYGANETFNSGDNLYNSAYWPMANFNSGGFGGFDIVDTIWDTGGWDIIDMSDQLGGGSIDLREGAFSAIGPNFGLLGIAFGTTLEEAIGSGFGDLLTGNEQVNHLTGNGGNDILEGYGGDDMMHGNQGNDTFVYKMNDGNDTINEMAGAGRDTLDVGLFLGLDAFAEDLSFSKLNNNLLVDFTIDGGISRGSVTIENQGWGAYRVETLSVLGVDVDLKYLWGQLTSPGQQFALTSDVGQYGLLVSPI